MASADLSFDLLTSIVIQAVCFGRREGKIGGRDRDTEEGVCCIL